MPPDPPRLADVRAWLRKASQDLRAAEVEWDGDRERLASDIVFHCQQAAEKALKAYLAWHDLPFR
jgi:HEPN domain-containing protein